MTFQQLYTAYLDIKKKTNLYVIFLLNGHEKFRLHLTAGKVRVLYGKYEVAYFYKYEGLEDADFVIALRLDYDS